MKDWIKRRLGIDKLEQKMDVLDSQQKWNIEKIIEGIRGHYVVMANNDQTLHNTRIEIPEDKDGVLVLGNRVMVGGCYISGERANSLPTIVDTSGLIDVKNPQSSNQKANEND